MIRIEVLGKGCPKCKKTEELIADEIEKAGIDADLDHITDLDEIVERGVMMTPAVVIDGEIKVEGDVPSPEEIRSWFE